MFLFMRFHFSPRLSCSSLAAVLLSVRPLSIDFHRRLISLDFSVPAVCDDGFQVRTFGRRRGGNEAGRSARLVLSLCREVENREDGFGFCTDLQTVAIKLEPVAWRGLG